MNQGRTGSGGTNGLGALLQLLLCPTCPGGLTVGVVDGNVGTLRHDVWADRGLVQQGRADTASKSRGEEPVEDASHDEADHDQAENHDETGIKNQLGDEATWRDFVDVASVVTLGEARNRSLEIIAAVEDEGSIFPVLRVAGKDGAEGSVDVVVRDGGFVGGYVGCHVEDRPIDYEVIGEPCNLVPAVPGPQGGVPQAKGRDSLFVESTKFAICRDFARVIDRSAEGTAGTCGIKVGGSLKVV